MNTIIVPLTETHKMVSVLAGLLEYQMKFNVTMSGGNWEIEILK